MSTGLAAEADIRAEADDAPRIAAARVWLAEHDDIIEKQRHGRTRFHERGVYGQRSGGRSSDGSLAALNRVLR